MEQKKICQNKSHSKELDKLFSNRIFIANNIFEEGLGIYNDIYEEIDDINKRTTD